MLIHIRSATPADQATINRIVRRAGINPLDLDWRRFVVAEEGGQIVGVGQVKPHGDQSRELASLAVIPARQGQGIGAKIIHALLARETGVVFLMCRHTLERYYVRFGFRRVEREQMTPYFRRMIRLANFFAGLTHAGMRVIVMKRGT